MNPAERLLDSTDFVGKRLVVISGVPEPDKLPAACARVALGLRLRQHSALSLRAMVEHWSLERIVKELH